jgi:hypothetical protein
MRHWNTHPTILGATRPCKAQARCRRSRLITLVLLLGVVTSAVSGCVFVPVGGWGYGHEYGRWHDRHGYYGYYRGERHYYYYGG